MEKGVSESWGGIASRDTGFLRLISPSDPSRVPWVVRGAYSAGKVPIDRLFPG